MLLFTFAVAVATGILFGLAPALNASRSSLAERLKESGRGSTGGAKARRFRHGLVAAEVAFSVVVMMGAGLLVRSLQKLLHVPAGFEASHLLTFNLNLSDEKSPERRAALARAVLDRLSLLPGVASAGAGTGLPPETPQRATGFAVAGRPIDNPDDARAYFLAVSPGYFRALGTPLLEGRTFNDADRNGGPPVVIVSRGLARRIFPSAGAVGRSLKLVNPEWPGRLANDRRNRGRRALLRTRRSEPRGDLHAVRADAVSVELRPPAHVGPSGDAHRLRSIAGSRRRSGPRRGQDPIDGPDRLVHGGSAAVSDPAPLGLRAAGAAPLVDRNRRRHLSGGRAAGRAEIGIRVALGARSSQVLRMIAGQGIRLVLLGLAAGVLAALGATRVLARLLFEVGTTDPLTFLGIGTVLAAVGLLASVLPARKALKVDPVEALRNE